MNIFRRIIYHRQHKRLLRDAKELGLRVKDGQGLFDFEVQSPGRLQISGRGRYSRHNKDPLQDVLRRFVGNRCEPEMVRNRQDLLFVSMLPENAFWGSFEYSSPDNLLLYCDPAYLRIVQYAGQEIMVSPCNLPKALEIALERAKEYAKARGAKAIVRPYGRLELSPSLRGVNGRPFTKPALPTITDGDVKREMDRTWQR